MNYQTRDKILRLNETIVRLKSIVGKRNDLIRELRMKLYDPVFMFKVFMECRLMQDELFHRKMMDFADFFLLFGVQNVDKFNEKGAMAIVETIPEMFHPLSNNNKNMLKRLERLRGHGYVKFYRVQKECMYFITSDGQWFVLQVCKIMRERLTALLRAETKPKRKIWNRKKV